MSLKEILTKILNALKGDYITEIGAENGWKYRKWNSGRMEAVLYMTGATYDAYSTINGLRRSALNNLPTMPTFTSIDYANANGANSGSWLTTAVSGTDVTIWNYSISGTVVATTITVEVIGLWK